MKENRYTLPTEERTNMVSEPLVGYSQLTDLRNQLVERVMNIQNPQTLQSLIVYVDKKVLPKTATFEEEWKRSISIEEFRKRCKSRLKTMYGEL